MSFCGPFNDVVVSLMATLANQERLRISDRCIRMDSVPGRCCLMTRALKNAGAA